MNTKIKHLLAAPSICSALLVSGVSAAKGADVDGMSEQMVERMTHKMHGQSFKKMARKLDFTDEQKAQAKVIKSESKAQMAALKPALKAYRQQVKALMSADNFDKEAFSKLHESNQDIFAAQALIKAQTKFKIKSLLTTEQKEKMATLKSQRKQRS